MSHRSLGTALLEAEIWHEPFLLAHYRAETQAHQPLWIPIVGLGTKTLVRDYLALEKARVTIDYPIQEEDKSLRKQPHIEASHFQFEKLSIC